MTKFDQTAKNKSLRVLSIDGGGVRGILPTRILSLAGSRKSIDNLFAANINLVFKKGLFAKDHKINLNEPLMDD